MKTFHLIGIGGVGMSALATALVRLGHRVTGADRNLHTKNVAFLESLGVRCFPDDGSGIDAQTDEVVVSTAIEADNPGLRAAAERGIPVVHRAKALAAALAPYRLVAVVGTCGKSTVTAMLGHVLSACGLDPMCVNGANVPGWEGAVRFGRGAYAVAEVDESDKSLVAFSPYAAIVTNASADHYSKEEMDEVFDAFVRGVPGPVVDARGETYPPEDFNRQNASLAIRMAVALGVERAQAEQAMASFGGVERRLQKYGVRVYDDYAHNPEKLRAMWLTLAKEHPRGLCVVWRPHGYAPLRKMLDALAETFREVVRECDRLLLVPVYDAGGTADRSISSEELLARLPADRCELVADLAAARRRMLELKDGYEVFVTAGARDPGLAELAAALAGDLGEPGGGVQKPEKPPKTAEELAAIAYLDRLRSCEGEEMPAYLPLACIVKIVGYEEVPKASERYAMATVEGPGGRRWRVCIQRYCLAEGMLALFLSEDAALPLDDARFADLSVCKLHERVFRFGFGVKERRRLPFVKRNVYRYNCGVLYPLTDFPELRKAAVGDLCAASLRIVSKADLQRRAATPPKPKAVYRPKPAASKPAPEPRPVKDDFLAKVMLHRKRYGY